MNHSVIYREGQLFVAETAGLYTAAYSGSDTSLDASDFKLYVRLPSETGGHWSRTVIVGPDNRLYPNVAKAGGLQSQDVKGEAVIYYRNPLTTQDLKSSGFPEG